MNKSQQKLIYAASAVAVAMLLYPPFHLNAGGNIIGKGFSWAWRAPDGISTVNVSQLAIQLLVVGVVSAVIFFALKDNER